MRALQGLACASFRNTDGPSEFNNHADGVSPVPLQTNSVINNISQLMEYARIIVPLFFSLIHSLALHVNITTPAHPSEANSGICSFDSEGLVASPLSHRTSHYPVICAYLQGLRQAPGRTISIPFFGKIAPQPNIVRVSGRPLGTIVGIVRSYLRHLSR